MDSMWSIISNREAIAINQAWFGHPGRLVKDGGAYQVWAKKVWAGAQAMLVLSTSHVAVPGMNITLSEIGITSSRVHVRDVWLKKDLPDTQDIIHLNDIDPF